MNKTLSLYAETGYIRGIQSERPGSDGIVREIRDDFWKLIVGIEISFIRQKDSDKDGVIDLLDKCPDTPKGTKVDEHGCDTSADTDGDGVPDNRDKCPNTPKGAAVDEHGCVDHKVNIDLINNRLSPVYFDTNISSVTTVQNSKVDELVKILNEYPEYNINLYGHADPRGSAGYNMALSQRRINSVVALLKARGVSDARIRTKAFGDEMAPQGELSEQELQENRKVATYMFIMLD